MLLSFSYFGNKSRSYPYSSPTFKKCSDTVLEYSIKVGSNIEKLNLNIILNDLDARYEVVGNDNFKSGKNVVSIFVTAADGSERVYTINVNIHK